MQETDQEYLKCICEHRSTLRGGNPQGTLAHIQVQRVFTFEQPAALHCHTTLCVVEEDAVPLSHVMYFCVVHRGLRSSVMTWVVVE